MKRQEKADKAARILARLYPDPPIPLQHDSPFTLLIAVLLSAQTTDARVNLVDARALPTGQGPPARWPCWR